MIAKAGHYEPICREAYPYVAPTAVLAFIFWLVQQPWIALVFVLVTLAVALFFRNPKRTSPTRDGIVLAPADGIVVHLDERVSAPSLEGISFTRVSIFMSVLDVHVNRSPVSGRVERVRRTSGGFLDARNWRASWVNERNSLILDTDHGTMEVVQVAGKIARRISCWVKAEDEVGMGERFGLIHFGSRLDVYLPSDYSATVRIGSRVVAGVTPIAETDAAG
ncbi:phosphatidylserine decarboxylase [Thermodesulfobacteriota bacterium]